MTGPASSPQRQRFVRRLLYHHLVLAGESAALLLVLAAVGQAHDWRLRWSIAMGYIGTIWLGATLLLGPLNVLRARPNPVSTDLRRDIGIWSAVLGGAHVLIVLPLSGVGIRRLLASVLQLRGRMPRPFDVLTFANPLGLGATILLALLLALSNDMALRALKPRRWKALQRLNYGLFGLVVLHGVLYQRAEHRPTAFVVGLLLLVVLIVGLQLAAVWRRVRRSAPTRRIPRSRTGPANR